MRTRRLSIGTRVPPGPFAFVSAEAFDSFQRQWREIDSRFPPLDPDPPPGETLAGHWENLALLRKAARAELRRAIARAASEGCAGTFAVPLQ